jgi:signal transduction histidine kinase
LCSLGVIDDGQGTHGDTGKSDWSGLRSMISTA